MHVPQRQGDQSTGDTFVGVRKSIGLSSLKESTRNLLKSKKKTRVERFQYAAKKSVAVHKDSWVYDFLDASDNNPNWKAAAARVLMNSRLFKVCCENSHTPLTLAGASKRVSMLSFMISEVKIPRVDYGPTHTYLLDLTGLEISFTKEQFWNRNFVIYDGGKDKFRMDELGCLNSAIEWLCRQDQVEDDGREDNILDLKNIAVIENMISAKWDRTYLEKFQSKKIYQWVVTFILTGLTLFTDAVPQVTGRRLADIITEGNPTAVFLYLLLFFILFSRLIFEIPIMYMDGLTYWGWGKGGARGVVQWERFCNAFLCTAFFTLVLFRMWVSGNGESKKPSIEMVEGAEFCLAVCTITSWLYVFYFWLL